LNAYYEYGGLDNAPLNVSQKRFETNDPAAYWKQMDLLSSLVDGRRGEAIGVVAHSIRAVALPTIKKLHEESRRRSLVFHMHVEEQPKEVADCKASLGKAPMAALLQTITVDKRFTAVHCTHTAAEDLSEFAKGGMCASAH